MRFIFVAAAIGFFTQLTTKPVSAQEVASWLRPLGAPLVQVFSGVQNNTSEVVGAQIDPRPFTDDKGINFGLFLPNQTGNGDWKSALEGGDASKVCVRLRSAHPEGYLTVRQEYEVTDQQRASFAVAELRPAKDEDRRRLEKMSTIQSPVLVTAKLGSCFAGTDVFIVSGARQVPSAPVHLYLSPRSALSASLEVGSEIIDCPKIDQTALSGRRCEILRSLIDGDAPTSAVLIVTRPLSTSRTSFLLAPVPEN